MTALPVLLLALGSAPISENDYAFAAPDLQGNTVRVSTDDVTRATVVCFFGTECPMVQLYGPRMAAIAADYAKQGVRFVCVNSNRQDSVEDLRRWQSHVKLGFPLVPDPGQKLADQFRATRTPEVFVLDAKLQLVYQGAIDDQYAPGVNRSEPKETFLRTALDEVLAGKPVSRSRTIPTGCLIGRDRDVRENPRGITFTKQVSRVLQKHCIECHRSDEIGPFALSDYEEVAGWADTMVEVIDNGRMPPWHADPAHGTFANARHMPESDKQIIRDWVKAGVPHGDASDLPEPVRYVDGWQLDRKPDTVLKMRNRPFVVPATGVVEYQYFVVDPGFKEDKWVSAAQVIPGNRSVVHHAIVFIRPPDGSEFRGVGWLAGYVPGQRVLRLPPGRARKVPAGSKFVFQMHYTPTGEVAEDTTEIGMLFTEARNVTHEVYSLVGIDQEFEIPPNADNHKVHAEVPWLPAEGELLSITPHMHYRGKSFRLFAGEKSDRTLLSVPRYDFNWQHSYQVPEPIPLADVQKLRFEATFDNSAANPFNPDPGQWVTWGDQTWEEMAVAFFEIAEPLKRRGGSVGRPKRVNAAERRRKIDAYVKRVFKSFDEDGDGLILEHETPIVVRFFNFRNVDRNGDKKLNRDEVRRLAETLY